jgi:hypothetical protein
MASGVEVLRKNGNAVSRYSVGKITANRKTWIFNLSDGSEIEKRNDPMDHNHPIRHATDGNMTASKRRPTFRGFSIGPSGKEATIAICAIKYAPHTRAKTCQCFARRKKLVIPSKIPPVLRFSPA